MKKDTTVNILTKAIRVFGEKAQWGMVQEECAELIVAINKMKREPTATNKRIILCEIVDVEIMLEQAKLMICDEDAKGINILQEFRKFKIKRLEKIIEGLK